MVIIEKVLQLDLINYVVILLPELLVLYNFALSAVNLWPITTF